MSQPLAKAGLKTNPFNPRILRENGHIPEGFRPSHLIASVAARISALSSLFVQCIVPAVSLVKATVAIAASRIAPPLLGATPGRRKKFLFGRFLKRQAIETARTLRWQRP
jgi:hypothetical protein